MKPILLVFLGGGLGSVARFLIYKLMTLGNFSLPYGTFMANITGSLILGVVLGYSLKQGNLSQNTLLFLTTGFCGGFTTFSTFAFENQAFLRAGDYFSFSVYAFGSLFLGISAVIFGIIISKFI